MTPTEILWLVGALLIGLSLGWSNSDDQPTIGPRLGSAIATGLLFAGAVLIWQAIV